jgi:cell division protein FtsN
MLFGLAIGLSIAAAIHFNHRDAAGGRAQVAQPASAPPAESTDRPPAQAGRARPAEPRPESRFDFYELLPQFEVVLPGNETPVRRDGSAEPRPAPVEAPGSYVLQAGSFRRHEDADRMRATLALRGIESSIQRVQIDQDTFHRVRIGPIRDLQRLEQVRGELRDAQIEALLIRLPD